jgi:hypothetical protein
VLRFHSKIKRKEQTNYQNLTGEIIDNGDSSGEEDGEDEPLPKNQELKLNSLDSIDDQTFKLKGFTFESDMGQYYDPENALYYDPVILITIN